jgi:8-oxo-dGTP diphosphatase
VTSETSGNDRAVTYVATWNGETFTRTSKRAYTHASVVRLTDGTEVAYSFHGTEAAALRGVLTSYQKTAGMRVIAAVPCGPPALVEVADLKICVDYLIAPDGRRYGVVDGGYDNDRDDATCYVWLLQVDGAGRAVASRRRRLYTKNTAGWTVDGPQTPGLRALPEGTDSDPVAVGHSQARPGGKSVLFAPTADAEATSAVIRALSANTSRDAFTEVWERIQHSSAADFRADAIRVLGDVSELSTSTLNLADWTEVYATFHPAPQAPAEAPAVCAYSAAHAMRGVLAVTVIDCGNVVGTVDACRECADFYARMQGQAPAVLVAEPTPIEHAFTRTAFNEVQCSRCLGFWVRNSPAEPAEALDGSWPTECPGAPRTHGPRDQDSPECPAAEGCNCVMDRSADVAAEAEANEAQATADAVIFGERKGQLYLLLIMRGWEPFKGCLALPGGYVEPGELPEAAARRELAEETGLSVGALTSVGFYFAPGRDPRGRFVSSAYVGRVVGTPILTAGDDAAEARWVPVDVALSDSVELAFDHALIVRDALKLVTR